MSWFADLAGKAETLLNNLDEQTGVALRNHKEPKPKKFERNDSVTRSVSSANPKKKQKPLKKPFAASDTRSNYTPTKKASPTYQSPPIYIPPAFGRSSPFPQHTSRKQYKEQSNKVTGSPRRSPVTKKGSPQYTLHNVPTTMVGDVTDHEQHQLGIKQRRYSLPFDIESVDTDEGFYKYQNLEVENAMLKNELNVCNRELLELVDKLHKTEDGNDVDSVQELKQTHLKMENSNLQNQCVSFDKDALSLQLEVLKTKVNEITNGMVAKTKEHNVLLEKEVSHLSGRNKELENRIQELVSKAEERESVQSKLENELRHAQSTISNLQNSLENSTEECRRLEKDWAAYKLRVKSMLHAKDNEIKDFKEGRVTHEDTKHLLEQMERLREERDELCDVISRVRNECTELKKYMEQLETRHSSAERVVVALRDALKDERMARNRADAQCNAHSKELKSLQMETGQTIASLRTALRDKDEELRRVRETFPSSRGSDSSALNVADYDVSAIENDKIHCLTQTLVQKQTKIDSLLAQNNMLKIQLDKLESKYKADMTSLRTTHSVVQVQDGDIRGRCRPHSGSAFSAFSLKLGVTLKRHPIIRIFVIGYMICLHFWVLTVLFTNTPQVYVLPSKS